MTDRHIEQVKGANIRELRIARGMSLEEFADAISEKWGETVAANTVGYWERGERMISSTAMMYISQALSCPYSAIYRGIDYRIAESDTLEALVVELTSLPEPERETLRSVAEIFSGDKIALIKFVQLCILDLPPKMRREVLGMGIYMREQAEAAGIVRPAPKDMEYISEEWRRLY